MQGLRLFQNLNLFKKLELGTASDRRREQRDLASRISLIQCQNSRDLLITGPTSLSHYTDGEADI